MSRKQGCLFWLLFWLAAPLYAQVNDSLKRDEQQYAPARRTHFSGYELSGKVTDAENGEGIPFAPVFFANGKSGTTTDADGSYLIQVESLPHDSLKVQVIGYEPLAIKIDRSRKKAEYNFRLSRADNYLEEVEITPGEDPAIVLMREVIRAKPNNNPDKLENYRYEAYNKIQIDLLNFKRKTFERLPVPYLKKLGFIFDNMDSTSYDKPYLPLYLTEAISDNYYQGEPRKNKEFIRATQIKVLDNKNMMNSLSQYLGRIYLAINPYDNYVPFFDKEFVSPASNTALAFYRYKIIDTQQIDGHSVITLRFSPQRQGENCFEGTLRIVDSIYAIQYIAADMPQAANVNWVKKSSFYKEYSPLGDSLWFCTKENITAELELSDEVVRTLGFIVRKTTSYKDIAVNQDSISRIVNSKEFKRDVVVADSAASTGEGFWAAARHEELNEQEQGIYNMYDSLQKDRAFNNLKTLGKILATGGYKFGPIELGPYWNAYSYNQVEGNRFQFSMGTTPKLFKNIYLNGYVAYGAGDNRFKYNISSFVLFNRAPRQYFNFSYSRDIDYTVNYYDKVGINNIISMNIRKAGVPPKFMFADDVRVELYNEFFSGFSQLLTVYRKIYDPYDPLPSTTIFRDEQGLPAETLTATEVNLKLRFAYKEKFLNGNYYRFSLGSKYPIVDLRIAMGLKGVLGSTYDYQRVTMTVSDNWRIPPFGQLYLNLFGGKYFGTLPYPLLEQHPGNEFYFYNKYAFNMMNQYEFISDQFVGANLEHSLGGGLFKYIPLIKKLRFRQFWTAKGVIGTLSDANKAYNFNKGFAFRSLDGEPYVEVGTGVENILKVFRVDFIWRLTPQPAPTEAKSRYFGIFGSIKLAF